MAYSPIASSPEPNKNDFRRYIHVQAKHATWPKSKQIPVKTTTTTTKNATASPHPQLSRSHPFRLPSRPSPNITLWHHSPASAPCHLRSLSSATARPSCHMLNTTGSDTSGTRHHHLATRAEQTSSFTETERFDALPCISDHIYSRVDSALGRKWTSHPALPNHCFLSTSTQA